MATLVARRRKLLLKNWIVAIFDALTPEAPAGAMAAR
jgi:hypothetical protein